MTEMETDRQRNRFRLGVKGGRQAVFITARQVGDSWMSQTIMSEGAKLSCPDEPNRQVRGAAQVFRQG